MMEQVRNGFHISIDDKIQQVLCLSFKSPRIGSLITEDFFCDFFLYPFANINPHQTIREIDILFHLEESNTIWRMVSQCPDGFTL